METLSHHPPADVQAVPEQQLPGYDTVGCGTSLGPPQTPPCGDVWGAEEALILWQPCSPALRAPLNYQHWFQHSPTPATGMAFNCSPTQHSVDTQNTRISYCVGKEMLGDRKRILSIRLIIPTDFWDETAFFKLQLSCLLKYAINLYASHNLF